MSKKLQNLKYQYEAIKDSNRYDDKITLSTEILALETDDKIKANTFNNRGNAYYKKGEYDKAITDYNQAIELNPDFADAFNNRGVAYGNKKNYDRAISDYNQAIKLNPEYTEAFNNRGIAYDKKKDYDQAISDFNQAIELNPYFAEAFNNRGIVYSDKGEHDKAIIDYNQAIKLNQKYANAFYNRGLSYSDKGEHDKAITDFNQAIELNQDFAEAFYNRGLAYREIGNEEEALKDFKKANELDPTVIPKETTKNVQEKVEKTENFQEILEQLESYFNTMRKRWIWASVVVSVLVLIAVPIIVYLSKDLTSNIKAYPLYVFLFAIVTFVTRQYANAKQSYLEAKNRMAMAKILAHIENDKNKDNNQFLPPIIDAIVYSTRKESGTSSASLLAYLKDLLPKK